MQYTTEEYRNEMALPFRGKSSITIYLGLVNSDAQQNASITSSFDGDQTYLYDGSGASVATSKESDGSITFTFDGLYEINIAGLTMTFNGTPPSSITVTNGSKTETYNVYDNEFSFNDGYTNCHYIKITPYSGKLSLKSITFGIGLSFSDKQLINTSRNNSVNHISNELPVKRFTFTIDNRAHMFNKDNPYGYADFLQEKQVVTYEYGRELSNGSTYKIKGGKVLLKEWSSDDVQAKFTCVGYLDYLDGDYYKGRVYPEGISAFDLAEDVFEDAGILNYNIDGALKKVIIYNPIPVCQYREALKMIANASMSVLYEDRDGNICIKNSSRPSFVGEVIFTGATDYSTPSTLFDDNSPYNYADAEYNYTYPDGERIFLPEHDGYRSVGFVSSQIANSSGLFTNNPHIDINFVSEFSLTRMFLNFVTIVPTSITITCKLAGVTVDTQTLTSLSLTTLFEYSGTIDSITITFNSATPNQRIHLNNIEMDGIIEYELTYHDLKNTPVANSLERVSKTKVHGYSFYNQTFQEGVGNGAFVNITTTENEDGGETTEVNTGSSEYGAAISTAKLSVGLNTIILRDAYYNYTVTAGTIVESGAYYLVILSDVEQEVSIFAQPYSITDSVYEIDVHEKGVEKESNNILVSTEIAEQQGAWLRDYYDDDIEYSLVYRGDPILDADDLIYLENHFVSQNQIRITDESINTSMGVDFSNKLTARRTSFMVSAKVGYAIIGRSRIGEVL